MPRNFVDDSGMPVWYYSNGHVSSSAGTNIWARTTSFQHGDIVEVLTSRAKYFNTVTFSRNGTEVAIAPFKNNISFQIVVGMRALGPECRVTIE